MIDIDGTVQPLKFMKTTSTFQFNTFGGIHFVTSAAEKLCSMHACRIVYGIHHEVQFFCDFLRIGTSSSLEGR
uniref:Uncharacterized protein n=1 Tax=Solanum lycopersicum TaxID=4081 RepID=A0A3Q7H7Y6_SOLLC